jgi:3-methyladenine DNA glycosylase Tag
MLHLQQWKLTIQLTRITKIFFKLVVEIFTDTNILKHSLKFRRILKSARLLQIIKQSKGNLQLDKFFSSDNNVKFEIKNRESSRQKGSKQADGHIYSEVASKQMS